MNSSLAENQASPDEPSAGSETAPENDETSPAGEDTSQAEDTGPQDTEGTQTPDQEPEDPTTVDEVGASNPQEALTHIDWGDCPDSRDGETTGSLQNRDINEASGLAASRQNPGAYWVHNDSGDSARLFAVDVEGEHLATVNLEGANADDWEDMAMGPGPDDSTPHLYVADIGDNAAGRDEVQIYRATEPQFDLQSGQVPLEMDVQAVRFDVRYPDGAQDAEAFFIDPLDGLAYVITKARSGAIVFRVELPRESDDDLRWEKVGELDVALATGADIDASGSLVAVRSYTSVRMYSREAGETLIESLTRDGCSANSRGERQGETIAFSLEGDRYVTVSEGEQETIWQFDVSPSP